MYARIIIILVAYICVGMKYILGFEALFLLFPVRNCLHESPTNTPPKKKKKKKKKELTSKR